MNTIKMPFKGINFTRGFRPGNVAATFVLVASTLFANTAMAVPTDYIFIGSNNPVNVETPGTLNGFFTLESTMFGTTQTGTSWSWNLDHNGERIWDETTPNVNLAAFDVITTLAGDVTSIYFDTDTDPFIGKFLEIIYDVGNTPGDRNTATASHANSADPFTRLFLDNVSVSQAEAVPEPSIIALFGLGLAGLGFARRRRQS
jgi:hypothetical protein